MGRILIASAAFLFALGAVAAAETDAPPPMVITVSPTNPAADFPSFGAAIASLGGFVGVPTTIVALDAGPFFEQVTVGPIAGTSAVNTLTLQGPAGGMATINNTSLVTPTIFVSTTPFVILRDLEIKNTSNGFGLGCVEFNNSSDGLVAKCDLKASGTNNFGIRVEVASSNVVIRGCEIDVTGGDEGIHVGSPNPTISNNIIVGYAQRGINVHDLGPLNPQIFNNTIMGVGDAIGFVDLGSPISGADVFNNILVMTGPPATSAGLHLPSGPGIVFLGGGSNFNLFFATGGGAVSRSPAPNLTLAAHQAATSLDANSRFGDPLFLDAINGDFHLQSFVGTFNDASGQFDLFPPGYSPGIDAGNPASNFSNEPLPNGGRINGGAFGNTPEASLSAPPPVVICAEPIGFSTSGGTRVRVRGFNFLGSIGVTLGATYPSIEGTGLSVSLIDSTQLEFTTPALLAGQKFIEVTTPAGTSEIREAVTASDSVGSASQSIAGGSTPAAYRMRSVPLFADAQSVMDQLTTCLGLYDPRAWRAFYWDAASQGYAELPGVVGSAPTTDLAGRGIFLIAASDASCAFTGLSTDPATNFYLCLEPGWNMVSLPSAGSMAWSSVRVGQRGEGSSGANDVPASSPNAFISEFLFAYDGAGYVVASAMMGGESYWVYNKFGSRVVLFVSDPSPKAGEGAAQSYAPIPDGAPTPPAPPGSVESSFAADPVSAGGGGGGGGDSATQVGPADLPIWMGALLVCVWARVRARS